MEAQEAVQPLTAGDPEECLSADQSSEHTQEGLDWKFFLFKVLFSVTVFLTVSMLIDKFAEAPVTAASEHLMESIGLPGLFGLVFMADGVPQPFTYVPLIFMAVKGAVGKQVVFFTCAAASYSAGICGYIVGASIKASNTQCLDNFVSRLASPAVLDLMTRKGAWGVFITSVLPMPLAIATWTAGYVGVELQQFVVAPVGRLPKIALFVLLSPSPQSVLIADTVVDQ